MDNTEQSDCSRCLQVSDGLSTVQLCLSKIFSLALVMQFILHCLSSSIMDVKAFVEPFTDRGISVDEITVLFWSIFWMFLYVLKGKFWLRYLIHFIHHVYHQIITIALLFHAKVLSFHRFLSFFFTFLQKHLNCTINNSPP